MPKVIVPNPCHFKTPTELCETTHVRMREAFKLYKPGDDIVLSGDVPNIPGGPTLGALMKKWFIENGVPKESLIMLRGGVGTFSEARSSCQTTFHLEVKEIVMISSNWYLFAGSQIWRRRAKEYGLNISFVSLSGTGGGRTWLLYGMIGLLLRTGSALGLEMPLEKFFTAVQQKRTQGFTLNGCA